MTEMRLPCTCESNTAKFCPVSQYLDGKYRPMKVCATQERDLTRQGQGLGQTENPATPVDGPLTRRIREVAEKKKAAQG